MSDRAAAGGSREDDGRESPARGDTPPPRTGCDWLEGVSTLSEVVRRRAERDGQADFRFLFVSDDEIPASFPHAPAGDDRSVAFSFKDAYEVARRAAYAL